MPFMYSTGSADGPPIGCSPKTTDERFPKNGGRPKILFNIQGAGHLDPMFYPGALGSKGRELIPGALFLACHVRDDKGACDRIYGANGKAICGLGSSLAYPERFSLAECQVVR